MKVHEVMSVKSAANGMVEMLTGAGYSDQAIAYYLTRPSMGRLQDADQVTELTGDCGDTMTVYLKLDGERIGEVSFEIQGCAGTITAAMAAADLIRGKTLAEAASLTDRDVLRVLKTIPDEKIHCIHLAVKSLHKALQDIARGGPDATV